MRKTFSTIQDINWDTDEYSYHSLKIQANQHCNHLDREVFVVDLIKLFYDIEDLLAITLQVEQIFNYQNSGTGLFSLPETMVSYQFSFHKAETSETFLNTTNLDDEYMSTVKNYFSPLDQARVLKWFLEQAQDFQAEHEVNSQEKICSIVLTEKFLHYCAQQAYGVNYPLLQKQILEKRIQTIDNTENTIKKRKI